MEENNNQQDRGIEELLTSFELELQNKEESENKEGKEVENVKYYGTFKIKEIEFENIFIMTETDSTGKQIQHVYSGNTSNELLTVDAEGNVDIKNPALQKYLSGVDFTKTLKQNDARLRAISGKGKPEDIKKALDGEENSEQDTDVEEIDADLQAQGQDLEITSYKPIKDNHIAERMPEVFGNGEEHGIAYSSKLNRFVIASKVNGQYQINENVEPSKVTLRSIISIDEKGEKVERKVPYALMKLPNDPNKEIAVTIGQYGIVDIQTVDLLPNQQRLARQVRVGGEELSGEEYYNTRRDFETEGKYYSRDIVEGVQELEQQEAKEGTIDRNRTEDDIIPGTDKTWGELMEETGESLPKLIERYNREMENNGDDSEKAIDTIEDDYGMVNREHNQ